MNKKVTLLTLLFVFTAFITNAQVNFQWAKSIGGSSYEIGASAIDGAGNIYTAGHFMGTADFDPGPGVYTLTAVGSVDIFVCKLDASGAFIWAKAMGGAGNDYCNSLAVDIAGNVYTTGRFHLTSDFDPGMGVYNYTSQGGFPDIFISKLDASGTFVWAKQIGGSGFDCGYSITVDGSGNVYTTGQYDIGTADFDPGVGVYNLTNAGGGGSDIFVSKLDVTGNFVWAKSMGGVGSNGDVGNSIAVDASGNVYTTGQYATTADFDPGPSLYNLPLNGITDIFVSKLDVSGNFVWAKKMGGSDSDYGQVIKVDAAGNVYTTGSYQTTADFDPGPAIFNLTTSSPFDIQIFVSKLDASGSFVWAKGMGGISTDYVTSIAIDATGNVYTTGIFNGISDFDPGAVVYNLSSLGSYDIFISKLDVSGAFVWAKQLGDIGNDNSQSILVDGVGNVFTTGSFESTVDFDPGSSIYNLTSAGSSDVFIHKMSPCTAPASPTVTAIGTTTFCNGGNVTLVSNTQNTYLWSNGATTQSILVSTSGNYYVLGFNVAGCPASSSQIPITVNPLPTITVVNGTICPGKSFNINPSGALTYTVLPGGSTTVSPLVNTSYSIMGTSAAGCVSSSAVISNVLVLSNPTISASSNMSLICTGQSVTLTASGANTYSWSTGIISTSVIVSPTITTTYTVIGLDNNSCSHTIVFSQSVSACTGNSEYQTLSSEILIYPNPSKGFLNIESETINNECMYIQLTNTLGQVVFKEKTFEKKSILNIDNLPKGIYFVTLKQHTLINVTKIIKE